MKDNPEKLCAKCRAFDRDINGQNASCDIWVDCNHEEERSMSEWISVKDRLPLDYEDVLVYVKGEKGGEQSLIYIARYREANKYWDAGWELLGSHDVTHWMPLPGAPNV